MQKTSNTAIYQVIDQESKQRLVARYNCNFFLMQHGPLMKETLIFMNYCYSICITNSISVSMGQKERGRERERETERERERQRQRQRERERDRDLGVHPCIPFQSLFNDMVVGFLQAILSFILPNLQDCSHSSQVSFNIQGLQPFHPFSQKGPCKEVSSWRCLILGLLLPFMRTSLLAIASFM